jgi:raffinose/stachyose/melibiose transport system permease protein
VVIALRGGTVRRGATRAARRTTIQAYALIAPAGFFYAAFQLFPIVAAILLSFTSWNGLNLSRIRWIGLANYERLVQDELFWGAAAHNLIVAVLIFVLMSFGSFVIAAVIHAGIRGGAFLRIVFFAPVVISSVALAMLSIFFFSPSQGLINEGLRLIGLGEIAPAWLGDPFWALPAVTLTYILQNFGFSLLMFLSGLTQVNDELCEAAELDGASQGRILWSIVLPSIRPIATVVVLLGFINSFRLFDTVYVMTAGGPYHASDTLVTYLYGIAFGGNDIGYANAIGVALFLILCAIAAIQLRLTRERSDA